MIHEPPATTGFDYRLVVDGSADDALDALREHVPFCADATSSEFSDPATVVAAAQGLRNALNSMTSVSVEIAHA